MSSNAHEKTASAADRTGRTDGIPDDHCSVCTSCSVYTRVIEYDVCVCVGGVFSFFFFHFFTIVCVRAGERACVRSSACVTCRVLSWWGRNRGDASPSGDDDRRRANGHGGGGTRGDFRVRVRHVAAAARTPYGRQVDGRQPARRARTATCGTTAKRPPAFKLCANRYGNDSNNINNKTRGGSCYIIITFFFIRARIIIQDSTFLSKLVLRQKFGPPLARRAHNTTTTVFSVFYPLLFGPRRRKIQIFYNRNNDVGTARR